VSLVNDLCYADKRLCLSMRFAFDASKSIGRIFYISLKMMAGDWSFVVPAINKSKEFFDLVPYL